MRRIVTCGGRARWIAAVAACGAASLAATGCGTQLGAAALYGNQRVSSTTLANEVANLNAGYAKYEHRVQIGYARSAEPREVLTWMLRFATGNQMAARNGIIVTTRQAQAAYSAESRSVAQSGDTLAEAAVINGLPPDMLPELGRWIVIQSKLQDKLDSGVPPKTTAQQNALLAAVNHQECLAAKSLSISVNPQFGVFDYSQFAVVAATSTLAAAPGTVKSTPKPQTTPKC